PPAGYLLFFLLYGRMAPSNLTLRHRERKRPAKCRRARKREEDIMRSIANVGAFAGALLLSSVAGALAQDQVVRFLHNETDPPSIEFYNNAIKDFEAANPGIKIEMEAVSTDGRLQKVLASINTKTMPEVFKIL